MNTYQTPEMLDMSDALASIIQETPPESIQFIKQALAVAVYIEQLLNERGLKQKDLAEKLGKTEAEISKWLSGTHNFTLRSLAKIEAVLGENVIEVPQKKVYSFTPCQKQTTRQEVQFIIQKTPIFTNNQVIGIAMPKADLRKVA